MKTAVATLAIWMIGNNPATAEWAYQEGPDAGRHAAFACADGTGKLKGERLCFGLSCNEGSALSFGLSAEGDPDLLARADLDVQVFAGWRVMAPLSFRSIGLGTFEAPLTEAHLEGLQRLKAGAQMELRYWEANDKPPPVWRLTLKGSRAAIEAVEAACEMPDFEAQDLAARTMRDPSARVRADFEAACAALDGAVSVAEDYAGSIRLGASDSADLVLDHGALVCSTAENLVCGPAGCLHSIWQNRGDGSYTRVFLNAVQDVAQDEAGVRLSLKGSLCGRVGDGPCEQVWTLQDGELAPYNDE